MINVIPKPVKCEEQYGEFIINSSTSIYADDSLAYARDRLIDIIEQTCGYRLNVMIAQPPIYASMLIERLKMRGMKLTVILIG